MAPSPNDPADLDLVARMARGDEAALGTLYDRYGKLAWSLAMRVLGDAREAEEAVSDAFLQAWRQAASFDPDRAQVASWLVMITRSRALDHRRAWRRREVRAERAAADTGEDGFASPVSRPAPDPDQHAEVEEVRTAVRAALNGLPPEQKRAVELAYFAGLSHSEIAAELDEPLGTVKSRIRAAMEKLRGLLAAYS